MRSGGMENPIMCGNCFGNNSCLWIVLILIILFTCGGCGGNNHCGCMPNNCGDNCGCGC